MAENRDSHNADDLFGLPAAVETILLDALELSPAARRDHVIGATDDPAIRRKLLELLEVHASADARLDGLSKKFSMAAAFPGDTPQAPVPSRAGAYRLTREIGRGGMSVVYLGERDDGQFEQVAAVKVLPSGPAMESLMQRFEAERRILARMEHPNLARLLDGGITAEGWPYFVMEYVDGLPITDYCDRHNLDFPQRLEIFAQVLDVVQYAHRNLVVHRDLKPSNILVTPEGRVKLLDFGIAKVIDAEGPVDEQADMTALHGRPMSLAWASPEQVTDQPVSTASDVYGLGVLLYRLLSGHSPYQLPGTGAAAEVLRHAIVHETPLNPSVRVRQAVGAVNSRGLANSLRGDLDTIVQKALRKEPDRRYASVEQFAEDLERYRLKMPVRARPDHLAYRVSKFIRRNPWGVAAGFVVPLLIVVGLAAHTHSLQTERDLAEAAARSAEASARLAEREAARSRQVSAYLVNLFKAADPGQSGGESISALDLVARGTEQVGELEDDPLMQAEMLRTLGEVNSALGQYQQANDLFERALRQVEALPEAEAAQVANLLNLLGMTHFQLGRLDAAEATYQRANALALVPDDPVSARTRTNLGIVYVVSGRFEQAEAELSKAVSIFERTRTLDADHATALSALGTVYSRLDRNEQAAAALQQAIDLRTALFGAEHPSTNIARSNLAVVLSEQGQFAEAESLLLQVLEADRRILGPSHPSIATLLVQIAAVRIGNMSFYNAMEPLQQAFAIQSAVTPEDHPLTATILANIGRVHRELGDLEQAENHLLQSIEMSTRLFGPTHRSIGMALHQLALVKSDGGSLDEARDLMMQVVPMHLEIHGMNSRIAGEAQSDLARLHFDLGEFAQAREAATNALQALRLHPASEPARIVNLEDLLARISGL